MVTDTGGIDDRSFNASSWQGMQEAQSADPSGVSVKYLQSNSQSDYVPNINAFIQQKCGIIVTVGFLMAAATQSAAKAHASQKMAIVDNNYTPALKNVDALLFNTVQDGFLGGYLAAGMSKTRRWPRSAVRSCPRSPSTWTGSGTACSTTTPSTTRT